MFTYPIYKPYSFIETQDTFLSGLARYLHWQNFQNFGKFISMTTAKCNSMLKGCLVASCENGNLVKTYMVFQGNPDDLCNTINNSFCLLKVEENIRLDWSVQHFPLDSFPPQSAVAFRDFSVSYSYM